MRPGAISSKDRGKIAEKGNAVKIGDGPAAVTGDLPLQRATDPEKTGWEGAMGCE